MRIFTFMRPLYSQDQLFKGRFLTEILLILEFGLRILDLMEYI
ncbi:hypothetical protein D1AOALGA4SA_6139 [Olavius algarvensis Delta 1 endosymbiont]|nr:hypothetical protein D1AOALGA4SA_6139 [Olavius algarvensis Delta 1 endosymbiont]